MDNSGPLYAFLFFAILATFFAIRYLYERKRSEALRLQAGKLGFFFETSGSIDVKKKFGEYSLFSRGHGKRIRNRMWGRRNGCQVMVFEYQYTVGGGRNSRTYRQTVLSFECDGMHLPSFDLRPESFFGHVGQAFGYQDSVDIDFETHPLFSNLYQLRGRDADHIRRAFEPDVLTFLERRNNLCLAGQGNMLVCYRQSRRYEPHDVKNFLEEGTLVQRLFGGACDKKNAENS